MTEMPSRLNLFLLTSSTLGQKTELVALTKALYLGAGKKINIYWDSRYTFATAHLHRAIYHRKKTAHIRGGEKPQAGNLGSLG